MSDKKYKVLDGTLNYIENKYIVADRKTNRDLKNKLDIYMENLKENIITENPVYKHFLKKKRYTGSVYDNVSVGKIYNEFDINFIINIGDDFVEVEPSENGYVSIKLKSDAEPKKLRNKAVLEVCKKWCDGNEVLPQKFQSFWESVLTKCGGKFKKSGPAFTFRIDFDVDLDVVFALEFEQWRFPDKFHNKSWIAVAKMSQFESHKRCWRYSFPDVEKQLLNGHNTVKPMIRFIKRIRENCKMSYLSSYYIKTVFLWEIERKFNGYWNQSKGIIFMEMLNAMKMKLESGKLENYSCKDHNLLDSLSQNQIKDSLNRINNVINEINKYIYNETPEMIKEIILSDIEQQSERQDQQSERQDQQTNTSNLGNTVLTAVAVTAAAVGLLTILKGYHRNRNQ